MKITLPKQVSDLGVTLSGHYAECERIRADIERAAGASAEAERLAGELEALGQRRAELKAQAFISRTPADLTEIDAQEEKMERASRMARSDGAAAAIAITLLSAQLAEVESKIEQIIEERRLLALSWLEERRERALDRYVKALADLGPILAEAAAADMARVALGDFGHMRPGRGVLDGWLKTAIPMPYNRMEVVDVCGRPNPRTPIAWRRDLKHGASEHESLLALFREAGLLPPLAAAAIEEAATSAAA